MQIQKAFKFRLYPDSEQQAVLAKHFGHARFVYNHYLDLRKSEYQDSGRSLNYHDCAVDLTQLKASVEFSWLKEASAQVLQQSLRNLDKAFDN
jgi:putative transposase